MTRAVAATYALAIVGGGRMGEAIARGLVASHALAPEAIVIAEPSPERRALFSAMGINAVADASDAAGDAETVLLAVKPQVIAEVTEALAEHLRPDAVVVSIAAGVTTRGLETLLPEGTAVVRVMPNTPAMVGAGMAVVSGGAYATPEHVESVRAMFEAVGEAVIVPEDAQDAATAISGSGPAYVALFIDVLTDAGVGEGLTREVARRLAIQTFRGTADLLAATGMEPRALIDAVSSPGGTTVAALGAMRERGVSEALSAGVRAAVARAKELGS